MWYIHVCVCVCVCMLSCFSHLWLLDTLWIIACQAPLSMGILEAKTLKLVACPPPGNLPDPEIQPASPRSTALAGSICIMYMYIYVYMYYSICIWQKVYVLGVWDTYSAQFSHSVVSNSLQPHGLQHTRLPCPSPTPRACSNSCPLTLWYHPTISSSVVPFSSHLQSVPASGSFSVSQFFASGGQSIGVSTFASETYYQIPTSIYKIDSQQRLTV